MQKLLKSATTKGDAAMFTGDVYIDILAKGESPSRVRVNAVHFTPGAHTAWHRHAVGQHLHIIEGTCLVQERGGEVTVVQSGETIFTAPGVWHWHGAAKDTLMTHLAIWEAPESGPEAEWGDPVSEAEYNTETS